MTILAYIIIALAIAVTLGTRRISIISWHSAACQAAAMGMFLLGRFA